MIAIISTEINLMPDWTIFVQMIVFLSTLAVLNFFIFKPTLRILDIRNKFTQKAKEEAQKLNDEAARLEKQRHDTLANALETASLDRERMISETKIKAEKMVADAKVEARNMIDKTEVSMETSEEKVLKEIQKNASEISQDIIQSIVGSA